MTEQLETPTLNELVNRDEEIELLRESLKRIKNKRSIRYNLLEWHGGPGIGKSQLVRLFADECNRQRIPWALVNFKEAENRKDSYEKDPALLLSRMIADLSKRAEINDSKHENFRTAVAAFYELSLPENIVEAYASLSRSERLYQHPDWLTKWIEVVKAFADLVKSLSVSKDKGQGKPVSFFFDETEYIASSLLAVWVEEWVINPLVHNPRVLVIWTARQPWSWKRPEVRDKLKPMVLPPFSETDVRRQLEAKEIQPDLVQEFFQDVYKLTNGHPFASAIASAQIQKEGWQEIVAFQEIFQKFICNYVFKDLPEDQQTALELTAFVRVFDSFMLRKLLQEHGGDQFKDLTTTEAQQMLDALKQTQFLLWRKGKGYALLPDLRRFICGYYLTNQRDHDIEVNQTALEVNRDWLNKVPDNLDIYAVEALYHMGALKKAGEAVDAVAEFMKYLDEYANQQSDSDTRQHILERLIGELEKDEELKEMLSGKEFSTVLTESRKRFDAGVFT